MSDIEQRLHDAGVAWRADQDRPRRATTGPRRSRSRWLPAAAAVAVVALAVGATVLGGRAGDPRPAPAGPAAGSWQPMSASPLSPRLRPTTIGWRDRVVVLGGDPYSPPCPPTASCVRDLREAPRDTALYDLPSDTWERLPDAPLPLEVSSSAVVGDVLYLWLPAQEAPVLALDLVQRRWSRLPEPPAVVGDHLRLVSAGGQLVAHHGEVGRADARDLLWVPGPGDAGEGRWETLPEQPFGASFDRSMVWTGEALVLVTPGALGDSGPPFMKAAVLEGQAWRVLPDQELVISGSTDWSWTGDRVVSATTNEADGGQTNGFGRSIPSGGLLDPATGRWSTLPATPQDHERAFGLPYAAGGRWVANGEGLVLDAERERWIALPPYDGRPTQDAGAAWTAGRLVVWGGGIGVSDPTSTELGRSVATGAVWTPPED